MIISEFAARTGTPAATIKYYVREGLLQPGERIGGNRTIYTEEHERRLRLVRAMLEVGKLSIASVKDVLAALDAPDTPIAHAFGVAQQAISKAAVPVVSEPSPESLDRVRRLLERSDTPDCRDNVGYDIAAQALDALVQSGHSVSDSFLDHYMAAAKLQASADLTEVNALENSSQMTELVVVGTVLGDSLALGLRRIAQSAISD